MDLDPKLQTNTKKEQVMQYMPHNVIRAPLINVPPDVIPPR